MQLEVWLVQTCPPSCVTFLWSTCIIETVQYWCFSKVQPSEGDGGEQGALRIAGSLQTLQRSGLRAARHHRLKPIVQDVDDPQRALLSRWTGAGHVAPLSVPLHYTHPSCVVSPHVRRRCALPGFHIDNLESDFFSAWCLPNHPLYSLCAFRFLLLSLSLVAHLSRHESTSESVSLHLRLINSYHLTIISHQDVRFIQTGSDWIPEGEREGGGGNVVRKIHSEVGIFPFG